MLGKTNITTVKGGTVVSDIADYGWDHVNANIISAFKKCFYANGILVGITMDGRILYMNDGENWITADLQTESGYKILDGLWDGMRFVFVGSHDVTAERCNGMVVITEEFKSYTVLYDCTGSGYEEDKDDPNSIGVSDAYIKGAYCGRLYAVALNEDATYTVLGTIQNSRQGNSYYMYLAAGRLDDLKYKCKIGRTGYASQSTATNHKGKDLMDVIYVDAAKKSNEFLFYAKYPDKTSGGNGISYYSHIVGRSCNGNTYTELENYPDSGNVMSTENYDVKRFNVFECKDSLYYMSVKSTPNNLIKLLGSSGNSKSTMSTGIDYAFVNAVYFNKSEIFINDHQMLIVGSGENVSDKTLDDLVEITYDFSLSSIVKAFDKLYVFGTGGNILVSNDEVKNEEALAVKTMSATKALYDAKIYTDEKYEVLEARITALETVVM